MEVTQFGYSFVGLLGDGKERPPGVYERFENENAYASLRKEVVKEVGTFIKKYYENRFFSYYDIYFAITPMNKPYIQDYGDAYTSFAALEDVVKDAYPEYGILDERHTQNRSEPLYKNKGGKDFTDLFDWTSMFKELVKLGVLKRYSVNQIPFFPQDAIESDRTKQKSKFMKGPLYYVNSPEGAATMNALIEEQRERENQYFQKNRKGQRKIADAYPFV